MNIPTQSGGYAMLRIMRKEAQAGFSLIELMISIAIGLILLTGLTVLMVQQSTTRGELEKSTRQIENGRYASQVMQEDIQLAGYYGEYSNLGALPAAMPDPCATTLTSLADAIPLPVQGYDSPLTVPAPLSACLSDANHIPGTDILVLRRVETTSTAVASGVAGQVYMQSGLKSSGTAFDYVLSSGADTAKFTLTLKDKTTIAPIRKFMVRIYYLSPCNVPVAGSAVCSAGADNGKPIPTLKRLELSVNGGIPTFTTVALVEGIENMQFDYGIDTTNDGAPDSYAAMPADVDAWHNVMAVRVSLLARNNDTTTGYVDAKQYVLGSNPAIGAFKDSYKRRVFTEVVRVINQSARRDK